MPFTAWQKTLILWRYWYHLSRIAWWRLFRPDLINLARMVAGPERMQELLLCEAMRPRYTTLRLARQWHKSMVNHHWNNHRNEWNDNCYLCQKEAEHYNHPPRRRADNLWIVH